MKQAEIADKRGRIRTLIQMGELLDLTPLSSLCDIKECDDLRLDHLDKAALLLGILSELADRLPLSFSPEEVEKLKNIGLKMLTNINRHNA